MKISTTLKLTLALFIGSIIACTKTEMVYLTFASAVAPKEVQLGQQIDCKVRLQFYTSSYHLDVIEFKKVELATNHFKVTAPTTLTLNGQTTINTTYWWLDTTYSFRPTDRGQYVIDFSDDKQTSYSDTIIVR